MFTKVMIANKSLITVFLCMLMMSCANTEIVGHWHDVERAGSYKHPMILGVSDSQQNRQLFEKYMVNALKEKQVSAIPSYTLISSKKKINRETVVDAIKGTDIDAVLVTYLVSADTEVVNRDSPLNTGYSGSAENNQISATIISNRGRSRDEEVFVLKNDLFDVRTKTLVWSVQTKTVGPESIDEVITDVTELLIKEMLNDGVIK